VGSIKVNTLVEVLCAEWFGAKPGVAEQEFEDPQQRSVPLYFSYRDEDVQPQSCCGGTQLSKTRRRSTPGIHFEVEDGTWKCCACNDEFRDAAFLMYTYHPMMKRVELACGGFSGESTAAMAARLNAIASAVKPQYITPDLQMGMYVVEFKFSRPKHDPDFLKHDFKFDVLPVAPSAIERRVAPAQPSRATGQSPVQVGPAPIRRRTRRGARKDSAKTRSKDRSSSRARRA
jgi:hypothetical protein